MTVAVEADVLPAGADFRRPEYRAEVFLRYYSFCLAYQPWFQPWLAKHYGWTRREAAWFAFLRGNSQNLITAWLMWLHAPTDRHAGAAVEFFQRNHTRLVWHTDRRYHKQAFPKVVSSYLHETRRLGPVGWWAAPRSWSAMYDQVSRLYSFARLSTWSYVEHAWLLGLHNIQPDTLMLDQPGSRSHRNSLCILAGLDEYDHWGGNPGFDGHYDPDLLAFLEDYGTVLLDEAAKRHPGHHHLGRFSFESALCAYKSWHRPNRRYPGVYMDLGYDRLRQAQAAWPDVDFGPLWQGRAENLPAWLRLEASPNDPGMVPVKQNWYRETGQVIVLDRLWPCFANDFTARMDAGEFARLRRFPVGNGAAH